jgi:hypothetical protein
MYTIQPVDPSLAENIEPLGTKPKYWYRVGETRMLFKAEERGTGEDWAEKVCCELAGLLGLPHVHYELAEESGTGKPGVICKSCTTSSAALYLGNEVLLAIDESYPANKGERYKVQAHTVDAVVEALEILDPPPAAYMDGIPVGVMTALDVFIGYLMLDAWVANQDRHHENWGVLWDGKTMRLAPTFDHGAALARNLSDQERKNRLASRDRNRQVPHFAARARSAFFVDVSAKRSMTTHQAWQAFAERSPTAAALWADRLAAIESPTIQKILEQVPPNRMSAVCRDFTKALLMENQRRILTDRDQ